MSEFELFNFNPDLIRARPRWSSNINQHHDYENDINQATLSMGSGVSEIRMLAEKFAAGAGRNSDYYLNHRGHRQSLHAMYGDI